MSANDDSRSKAGMHFYRQAAILDAYMRSDDPRADSVALEVILKVLRENAELRAYIFRSSVHPAWVSVLWENGFFRTPPAPQQTENGLVRLRWDEQEYLISIAGAVPDIALKHFLALKDEPEYGARAIYALQGLPIEYIQDALPQLLQWLRDPYAARLTAWPTYELAVRLAEKKQASLAFELFRAALTPQPPPKIQRIEGSFFGTEAVPLFRLESFDYGLDDNTTLKKALELFRDLDIRQTVAVVEDHLVQALRVESEA